ncbi:hypothetical protein [uncultured Flavobacterium sp.]|uniref:hypothetical protein n=1 Tax=uncultured Flavobacterium sp. TaxID=165435 RepID=UPI0030ED918B|tara:strand:+ start:18463 stop:18975 length:513 start_codon:yes stop_codon:yes gene_type:complete
MKKKSFFKEPLLISQEEMAMLLGITRSQWSMVALGQRGLSAKSKVKLATVQLHVNKITLVKQAKLVQEQKQEDEMQKAKVSLLMDNSVKQLQLQRKLTRMQKNFQAALNTLHFLASYQQEAQNELLLKVLEIKANNVLDKNTLAQQEVLKIKLEVLKYEETLLRHRKKKL